MNKNNALFVSYLFSKLGNDYTMSSDDIKYTLNESVTDCALIMYKKIIGMLANNKSYSDICNYIDNFSNDEFEDLLDDQKTYVKVKVKSDLDNRINKLKGEDIYE